MPFDVSFDKTNNTVCLVVSDNASREDHYAALEQAMQLCHEHGCRKLLVDLRSLETPKVTASRCFNFGESVAAASPPVMIAHVLPIDAKTREDVKFVSTVEGNRGRLVKDFETVEEARSWLMGGA